MQSQDRAAARCKAIHVAGRRWRLWVAAPAQRSTARALPHTLRRELTHPWAQGYSVKFSPFEEDKLAVATSQNFGIIGNGKQYVLQVCCVMLVLFY